MEKVLNQEEIDAMVRAARGLKPDDKPVRQRTIKPCNFRQAGQLTGDQVRSLNGLHEGFARSLTQSLGAYLRVPFEVNLVSVEQLTYGEFLERVPEVTYMMSLRVLPMNAAAAMQIDHALVFPLVDILLGGTGQSEALTREVSEIEEQIMHEVARIISGELQNIWAPLAFRVELETREPPAQMQRFLAPTEKSLCLNFEIKLAATQGTMNLVFPVAVSSALLRKLSKDWSYSRSPAQQHSATSLRIKMLDCVFPIELGLPKLTFPVRDVLEVTLGETCNLGLPVTTPASLLIAGREVFEAHPARHGRRRAAQLGSRIVHSEEERKA
jgi:flagellar motor switch protein FliM